MHKLKTDEIFHFYIDDPVQMLLLAQDGPGKIVTFGADILNGMSCQLVVSNGVCQGAKLIAGGKFALLGTTVAPGFEYTDYQHGAREELVNTYSEFPI